MRLNLCRIILAFSCPLFFGLPNVIVAQDIAEFSRFVKAHSDSVRNHLGSPDGVAYSKIKGAVIWTYYHETSHRDDRSETPATVPLNSDVITVFPIADALDLVRARSGVTQFAFWNDHVASVSHLRTEGDALLFYDESVSYMEERANWVGRAATTTTMRITRIGDDVWTVYRTPEDESIQTVVTIGDAGFLACSATDTSAERERVKRQFGLTLRQSH